MIEKPPPDPWPNPWLKGHGTECPDCEGAGSERAPCSRCSSTGIVSKPVEQIVAEMVAESRERKAE